MCVGNGRKGCHVKDAGKQIYLEIYSFRSALLTDQVPLALAAAPKRRSPRNCLAADATHVSVIVRSVLEKFVRPIWAALHEPFTVERCSPGWCLDKVSVLLSK